MNKLNKPILIILIFLTLTLLISCAKKKPRSKYIYTPKIQGKVIDAKTKKPIKDAYIKITWEVINYEHETWGELSEYYIKVVKFTTDKQGKFIMPMQKRSSYFQRVRVDENFLLIKHSLSNFYPISPTIINRQAL